MEAACIRGILPLTDLEPAAAGRSGLLGLTSLKGQMVGVIDLRSKLGLSHAAQGSAPKIVVLNAICAVAHCAARGVPANWSISISLSVRTNLQPCGRSALESVES